MPEITTLLRRSASIGPVSSFSPPPVAPHGIARAGEGAAEIAEILRGHLSNRRLVRASDRVAPDVEPRDAETTRQPLARRNLQRMIAGGLVCNEHFGGTNLGKSAQVALFSPRHTYKPYAAKELARGELSCTNSSGQRCASSCFGLVPASLRSLLRNLNRNRPSQPPRSSAASSSTPAAR